MSNDAELVCQWFSTVFASVDNMNNHIQNIKENINNNDRIKRWN